MNFCGEGTMTKTVLKQELKPELKQGFRQGLKQELTEQIHQYFDALYFCDLEILAQVFHPKAHYTCTTHGELLHLSMEQYFDVVSHRQSPASLKQSRQDKIISIDIVGDHMALAKVQCVIEPKFFTDFLSFIFIDGRWQIINKVFHYQTDKF